MGKITNRRSSRRTQEMRTAETRAKLIGATLDVLMAEGYQTLTTQRVCDVAGVSRGAMLHHFPNKATLIAVSIEHLLAEATDDIRRQAERVRQREISLNEFLDYLWADQFSDRLFYITLEHVTVARTDSEVRRELIPIVKRFHQSLDETWREFFLPAALPKSSVATALNLTLCLLRGMGVQTVLRPNDAAYYNSLLSAWKTILASLVRGKTVDRIGLRSGKGKNARASSDVYQSRNDKQERANVKVA